MSAAVSDRLTATVVGPLLPIMAVVLIAFLVIGLALPVLPLHLHQDLGFGAFVVGLIAGSQFAASLISRVWAGRYSDRSGAKRGVVTGLVAAAASGLLYLLSLGFADSPIASVTILLIGRALLGAAESFIITGAVSLGAGPPRRGERGTGDRLGRDGDVRRPCGRRPDWRLPLCRWRLCGDRAGDDDGAARDALIRRPAAACPAAVRRPPRARQRGWRRLGAWSRRGVQQRRIRRHPRFRFAALRRTWVESGSGSPSPPMLLL